MSSIYNRLGETRNAMKALKAMLKIDETASVSGVVEAVSLLCSAADIEATRSATRNLDIIAAAVWKIFLIFQIILLALRLKGYFLTKI